MKITGRGFVAVGVIGFFALAVVATLSAANVLSTFSSSSAPSGTPTQPLERLPVFDQPVTAADEAAARDPMVVDAVRILTDDSGAPEEYRVGLVQGSIHVLLDGLGPSNRSIFAFATTRGKTCLGLTGFTSGCYDRLPVGASADPMVGDPDKEGTGEGVIVWGLAASNVRRVFVDVNGQRIPTRLRANAFFAQLGSTVPSTSIRGVVVERMDGTIQTIGSGITG